MIFKQSRLGTRTSFDFGEKRVTHIISDRSGERQFSAPYDDLLLDETSVLSLPSSRPTMYLWAAGFPMGFAALRVGYDHQVFGTTLGLLAFGLILLGIIAHDRKWFVIRLDLVPVAGGQPLRVLRDSQYDQIIAKFAACRRQMLRSKYAAIRPGADPAQEKARFDWLLEQGIIDESEHQLVMSQLSEEDEAPAILEAKYLN